jgi:hypothetical protein
MANKQFQITLKLIHKNKRKSTKNSLTLQQIKVIRNKKMNKNSPKKNFSEELHKIKNAKNNYSLFLRLIN